MAFVHESCALLALLVLTLILHSVGTAALIDWAKVHLHRQQSPVRTFAFHRARNPAHRSDCLPACAGDSPVGLFLSVELLCRLGIGHLLFGGQFFDGRRLGPCSPSNVANAVPDGKYHRRADVWPLRRFFVCDRYPPG